MPLNAGPPFEEGLNLTEILAAGLDHIDVAQFRLHNVKITKSLFLRETCQVSEAGLED
jgi:hypothetical protein